MKKSLIIPGRIERFQMESISTCQHQNDRNIKIDWQRFESSHDKNASMSNYEMFVMFGTKKKMENRKKLNAHFRTEKCNNWKKYQWIRSTAEWREQRKE